ncbi:MAG TPA: OmpA family protein [Tepidisphaeraceae bacterium]|nr:OmpA family protein [Tepidisphaeraceae bacterium]
MGWAKTGTAAGLLLSILALGTGCQNKMYEQNKALVDENQQLRSQNESLRHQTAATPPPAQPVQPALQMQPQQTPPPPAEAAAPQQAPAQRPVEQIGGLETTVNRAGNTVVHLPSDVFFDSGQATLKSSAKASLEKVVAALKRKYASKKIRVEGHTDSQPIRVSKWASNQELSEARADAVKKYLSSHGIPSSHITTKGLGDTKPRSSDLAKNRRVEIVVLTGPGERSAAASSAE